MVKKNIFNAIALIAGTAIGAGFLGLPYVTSKSGFLISFSYLILIGLFVLFVQLCMGEVILRTKGNHHFAGYAEKYFGKSGKKLIFIFIGLYIFSALLAYLVAAGQSLSYVFFGNQNYALFLTILFWVAMSFLSFVGLRALKHFGKGGFIFIVLFIFAILILFFKTISLENLSYINPDNLFLPIGVILFSMMSFSSLPAAQRLLLGKEDLMKKAIFLGVLIPFIIYLIFMLVLVGNFGENVNPIATLSLGRPFALLGVLALFTSYLSLSISIRDLLRFDFKMKRFLSWSICTIIPIISFLIIQLLNLVNFIQILSLAGIISGGVIGISILLLNIKSKNKGNRKPEYTMPLNYKFFFILAGLFLAGIIFELFRKFGKI
jgi:tyrosine-specific transport protein